MVIEYSSQPIDPLLISYNVCHKENMLYPSAIQTSYFFLPKHARGRNDRDYYCDRYTYSDT